MFIDDDMFLDEDLPTPHPETPRPTVGSAGRYKKRILAFEKDGHPHPYLRHYTHWFFHNCITHPLVGILPNRRTVELHQLSSNWLNRKAWNWRPRTTFGGLLPMTTPKIPEGKRSWWLLHNVAAHIAIGLCPTQPMFAFHDWTAEKMAVPGWA